MSSRTESKLKTIQKNLLKCILWQIEQMESEIIEIKTEKKTRLAQENFRILNITRCLRRQRKLIEKLPDN
jgi:hypothetical protein